MGTAMYRRIRIAETPQTAPNSPCPGAVTGREVISVARNHAASMISPLARW